DLIGRARQGVQPAQVAAGEDQEFTLRVPTERDVATTRETFRFLGVAARPRTYVWRVLQGYADGKVKPWTGLPERPGQDEGFESGPTAPGPAPAMRVGVAAATTPALDARPRPGARHGRVRECGWGSSRSCSPRSPCSSAACFGRRARRSYRPRRKASGR